ncbi:MAG TPA: proline--tRNA ligase [Candidatus Limnocylindrales bacterium]|nr:proline--tRNA ligase [Candidatus Limnocylindrales bacterium]
MKYSKLFGKTIKDMPKDATLASHKLLYQGGFIRESTAGRYYFLPLGQKVQQKIIKIVKEEMDRADAQEIVAPILHPLYLWQETNRDKADFGLLKIRDRRDMDFVLGGTAEEMMVDLVRKFQISYKDLPFQVYQFASKFRDELRARGGLLRVREFIMKDGYSFHADEEDFKKEYKKMANTYSKIFERVGIDTFMVAADNGDIGGEYAHEFQVKSDAGEDTIFYVPSKKLYFNKEIAPTKALPFDQKNEEQKTMEEVEGKGIIGVEALAKFLNIPVEATTKTILFETEKGQIIAAALRGEFDIDETKLKRIIKCQSLTLIAPEKIKELTGAEVGYAGIINLPKEVKIFMDDSMEGRVNFEMGANRTNFHSININFGRDLPLPEKFYDFKETRVGDLYPETGEPYETFRGIEVGNIFQLGYHYSKKMDKATFMDKDGKETPYYMGCYGIGIGRTLGAIVESSHDERGIIWPKSVSPYDVHLISIKSNDKAEEIYNKLQDAGVEVLYDDREDISAGNQFADADLIGIPVRLVVSAKSGDKIEWKERASKEAKLLSFDEVLKFLK